MLSKQLKKISIIHVQQKHKPPFMQNCPPKILEEVAYSQYHVAKIILENKDAIVLKESLYENYTPKIFQESSSQEKSMFSFVAMVFPKGIPGSFDKLSPLQKDTLVKLSGPVVLFYLGQLTHIYKTSSEKECKLVDSRVKLGEVGVITEVREKQAIHWAKQAAIQSGKTKVLLVFGASHNFERTISKLNDPLVTFHKNINTVTPRLILPLPKPMEHKEPSLFFGASFFNAARNGHIKTVRASLENGMSVNQQDFSNDTALILAATGGRIEIVRFLLENKANVTLKNDFGRTALEAAIAYGHAEIAAIIKAVNPLKAEEEQREESPSDPSFWR